MDNGEAKVIQFPSKSTPAEPAAEAPASAPRAPRSSAIMLGLTAVALAAMAVNRVVYHPTEAGGRAVASVEAPRDAAWEKSLGERLAAGHEIAGPAKLGRSATLIDDLRYSALANRYAVSHRGQRVDAVTLNGEEGLTVDGRALAQRYASLFATGATSAKFASSEDANQETFTLVDDGGAPRGHVTLTYSADRRLRAIRTAP